MQLPLQITYRGLTPSEALDALVHQEAAKLERFFPRITSTHVLIERAYRHPRTGSPFHVRIELGVPSGRLTINSEPSTRATTLGPDETQVHKGSQIGAEHKDAALTVRDAFRRAKRRLQDHARVLRGDVKHHEAPAAAND